MSTPNAWRVCRLMVIYHRVSGHCLRYLRTLQVRIPSGRDYQTVRDAMDRAIQSLEGLSALDHTPLDVDYRTSFHAVEAALVHTLTTNLFKSSHPTIRAALLELDKLVGTWSVDIEVPTCDKAQ